MGLPSEKLRNACERVLRDIEYLKNGQANAANLRNLSRGYLRKIAEQANQALNELGDDEDTSCPACDGSGDGDEVWNAGGHSGTFCSVCGGTGEAR